MHEEFQFPEYVFRCHGVFTFCKGKLHNFKTELNVLLYCYYIIIIVNSVSSSCCFFMICFITGCSIKC